MKDVDVPVDLAQKVRASDLETLALAHGWKRMPDGLPGMSVLRRDDDPKAEILVPLDRTFLDYADRVVDAVTHLADSIGRPPRQVLSQLLLPVGDLLRFRASAPNAEVGFLAFPAALELLQSCKQSLMAAARTVRQPSKYFSRLGTQEADEYLETCRLGTERGSFVATVLCPLYGESTFKGQVPIPGSGVEIEETFSRKVVTTFLKSARAIVDAIENNHMETLVDQNGFETVISANICEALALTEEMVTEDHPLLIEAQLSPLIPFSGSVSTSIKLRSGYYPALRSVAMALRPVLEPKASQFVGRVVSLIGDRAQGRLDGGDIVLAFMDDERITKARLTLLPDDYTVAINAYRDGHNVSVRGILESAPRVCKIKDTSEFRDITAPSFPTAPG